MCASAYVYQLVWKPKHLCICRCRYAYADVDEHAHLYMCISLCGSLSTYACVAAYVHMWGGIISHAAALHAAGDAQSLNSPYAYHMPRGEGLIKLGGPAAISAQFAAARAAPPRCGAQLGHGARPGGCRCGFLSHPDRFLGRATRNDDHPPRGRKLGRLERMVGRIYQRPAGYEPSSLEFKRQEPSRVVEGHWSGCCWPAWRVQMQEIYLWSEH